MIKLAIKLILIISIVLLPPIKAKEVPVIDKFNIGFYFPSINAVVSRTDFNIAVDLWLKEFQREINIQQTNVKLYDHISNMRTDFDNRMLDLVVAPPLLLVKHFDISKFADGFTGTSTTGKPYDIVVLAKRNLNVKTAKDFKNLRLVLPSKDDLASVFLNSIVIPVHHKTYSQVFRSTQFIKKQTQIILELFFDKADVGVAYLETFNLMAELNPQILNSIKIINRFPIDSPNYSYFHYQFPEATRKYFIEEAIQLNNSKRSQEIMNNFRMTSLRECPVSALAPFIMLNKQDQALLKQVKL